MTECSAVEAASPLELLHPAGCVERVLVLGDRCPPGLVPPRALPVGAEIELALIAPSPAEVRQRGWLERALTDAARALAQHGMAYVLLPRGRRATARRRLRAAGLVPESTLVQLPGAGTPRYLVPLQVQAWRHALSRLIGARPRARSVLVAIRELPFGGPLLAEVLPTVAIVARRPGADPLASWVTRLGGATRPVGRVVVATSWRGSAGPVVLYCFAPGSNEPWGVAKVGPGTVPETQRLVRLGNAARAAGAHVPRPLASGTAVDRPVLVETVLGGRPPAELLMRSPERFDEVASAVAGWLERWNRATAAATTVSVDRLEKQLLAPVAALEAKLPDGAAAYSAWLAARCAALAGSALPLVATHNDLTMWNLRLHEDGALGVLDWAEAEDAGLPLVDFFYAVADAAAACDAYRSRLDALRSCFEPAGARAGVVALLQERLRAALQLTPEAAEVAFHACWLHHARNEQRLPGADGPFLEIVRWLARRSVAQAG